MADEITGGPVSGATLPTIHGSLPALCSFDMLIPVNPRERQASLVTTNNPSGPKRNIRLSSAYDKTTPPTETRQVKLLTAGITFLLLAFAALLRTVPFHRNGTEGVAIGTAVSISLSGLVAFNPPPQASEY
ncbi:hypothetical protein Bbelb_325020 [Branchiostoma belcheri]|nr:hypothetical protein Bbelb_325020 [Branchiostoma belcheri]